MCGDSDKNSVRFLADVADQIALRLRKRLKLDADASGAPLLTPDAATEVGLEVAEDIRKLWGGVSVYICKTDAAALDARACEIFEAWRREGFTLGMCRRFGLSEQRIRQIVALKRKEMRQPVLVAALPMDTAS